jgi:hypothetical protein
MPVLTSEVFRFLTPADPRDVWNELTRTGEPVAHLYGLTIQTDWEPQAALSASLPAWPALTGQILHAEPPGLLSYSLGDGPGMLPVYVTWELGPTPSGTIVRLYVDETGPPDRPGLELTWLAALETLRTRLASRRHEP